MFNRIREAVQHHQRQELVPDGLIRSAVLVPVFEWQRQLHLLMAKRTQHVEKHKGQISFPGGVQDPTDRDSAHTALREAQEEIGLSPNDVEVFGFLSDVKTFTRFLITPVVAKIPYPYPFRLSSEEVESLLEVPWWVFQEEQRHRRKIVEVEGENCQVDFYHYRREVIWGATARITRQLVELVHFDFPLSEREEP